MNASNIRTLITALRAPMPEHFEWDFTTIHRASREHCGYVGCAMGLAQEIGLVSERDATSFGMSRALNLPRETVMAIFIPASDMSDTTLDYGVKYRDVTPAMVADKLEALLNSNSDAE